MRGCSGRLNGCVLMLISHLLSVRASAPEGCGELRAAFLVIAAPMLAASALGLCISSRGSTCEEKEHGKKQEIEQE